jgi:hypothetical protein
MPLNCPYVYVYIETRQTGISKPNKISFLIAATL